MLGKLLKYEFQATGRNLWVVYGAMVLLSVGANLSTRYMSLDWDNRYLEAIAFLVVTLWAISLVAGAVITLVLMVHRFQKNLLTDEGYLMFTLPATPHHLIFAKLITAIVWTVVSVLFIILSVVIAAASNELFDDFMRFIKEIVGIIPNMGNVFVICAEILLMLVFSAASGMLQFYSALSVGYGFNSHKNLWSVIAYFVMQFVWQAVGVVYMVAYTGSQVAISGSDPVQSLMPMQIWHLTVLSVLWPMVLTSVVLYCITVWNLKKRLNLS